ncbi:MAG TPA: pyridoxal-phosphate dependent enzyme [Amycolatopsis sp.]|nr:pyridoxal-phosphate dependent enzyme [Amycolatopsis sp.]
MAPPGDGRQCLAPALGVAHASRLLGAKSTVVVPEDGSPAKIAALRTYPVDVVLASGGYDGAEAKAFELAAQGRKFVSAYNDPHVIAGQSTLVGEVAAVLGEDFTLVVPTGAGGLLAGTALGARRAGPDVRVLGVESAACHAVSAAVEAGHLVPVPVGETIADGLVGNLAPGTITPDIVREAGVRLAEVDESAIRRSVRELALTAGLVAEGSSAVGLAALRAGLVPADRPVVLVVSGRNIAAGLLAEILTQE